MTIKTGADPSGADPKTADPTGADPKTPDPAAAGAKAVRNIVPGRSTRVFNSVVAWLARAGVSLLGSRELRVRGRRSGEWRTTPVNLLVVDGQRYLVAPRGHTQWVRNIRVAGGGELRLGRRIEKFRAVEVADRDKPVVLRRYLRRWRWEVGVFFDGVTSGATDETLLAIAPGYPVFKVVAA